MIRQTSQTAEDRDVLLAVHRVRHSAVLNLSVNLGLPEQVTALGIERIEMAIRISPADQPAGSR